MRVTLDREKAYEVMFSITFISNRQDRPEFIKDGIRYEESHAKPWRRIDMFWIETHLKEHRLGSLCVEPDLDNPKNFTIVKNWFMGAPGETTNIVLSRAAEYFRNSQEYLAQVEWTAALKNKIDQDRADGFETRPKTTKPE